MGSIRNRQSQGPFKTSGTEMWPAKMCQWISSTLLSSWASSATTASKCVPDTQSRKENETPCKAAEELRNTFPICQPEGSRVLGGFGPPMRPAQELVSLSALGEVYRSIQGLRLISMQSISRLRPSVAQSCFKQLCISHRLGAPEKRYKTLKGLLAATGVDDGGAIGCVSGVPGQAFAPFVSAALLPTAVH